MSSLSAQRAEVPAGTDVVDLGMGLRFLERRAGIT